MIILIKIPSIKIIMIRIKTLLHVEQVPLQPARRWSLLPCLLHSPANHHCDLDDHGDSHPHDDCHPVYHILDLAPLLEPISTQYLIVTQSITINIIKYPRPRPSPRADIHPIGPASPCSCHCSGFSGAALIMRKVSNNCISMMVYVRIIQKDILQNKK